ncbi:hypothetical protein [Cohnella algarum]|uniref:hypothetical protein n=1 Tax=Cohnella algarum TaxID=2044859 RepID=UPI00196753AD|nr:hypothetical protein [Cohnella algarum]MBN2981825.1 hypothetical protein [Cohnella algarum]
MKVIEAKVSYPINARGGLYVLIEGTQTDVYKGASDRMAMETANRLGWKGDGQATIGIPAREGIDLYTRVYWFHEKL